MHQRLFLIDCASRDNNFSFLFKCVSPAAAPPFSISRLVRVYIYSPADRLLHNDQFCVIVCVYYLYLLSEWTPVCVVNINGAWLVAESRLTRKVTPAYSDGVYMLAGQHRPSPRVLSQLFMKGEEGLPSMYNRTALLAFFGKLNPLLAKIYCLHFHNARSLSTMPD